ncbi:hypothetical protein LXA43DRAFT_1065299 [Ganoderma leucocontextum]|nr:hypothetical protein LXA43DRAFT_1065299 [Ganoderma leucocontextum]
MYAPSCSGAADYFFNESQWPDLPARIGLAHRVNAVLQCHCYTAQHVYMRFTYLRQRQKTPAARRPVPRSPSPSAQKKDTGTRTRGVVHSVAAKLDILLEAEPSPTPEVAMIWADVLSEGVAPKDILTYALHRQVKSHLAESQNIHDHAAAQSSPTASSASPTSSDDAAPSRPLGRSLPQPRPSPGTEGKRKRRAPIIQLASSSSSVCHGMISGEDDSRLEPEPPSSSPGPVCVLPVELQEVADQLHRALSTSTKPRPTTF